MIKKIIITGFSGAGKTTLGKRIEEEIGLPVVFIDRLHFIKGREKRPKDEIFKAMSEICLNDTWIMDGIMFGFADQFLKEADLVIFIDPGVIVNTKNIFKRKIKNILIPRRKASHQVIKKIHFVNTRRIWTDRKGFRSMWLNLIDSKKGQFEFVKINKVNKRTSRQVIEKIINLNYSQPAADLRENG